MRDDDLVGIPYLRGGRGLSGADCIGLVWLYYFGDGAVQASNLWNVLPSGEDVAAMDYHAIQALVASLGFSPATGLPGSVPKPGNLVVFRFPETRLYSGGHHAGVVMKSERVLITIQGGSSRLIRLTSPTWLLKVVGQYSPGFL